MRLKIRGVHAAEMSLEYCTVHRPEQHFIQRKMKMNYHLLWNKIISEYSTKAGKANTEK